MQNLRDVELDEISLVDSPANKSARVLLTKRASLSTSTKETPQDRTWLSNKIRPLQEESHRDAMDETQSSMRKQDGVSPVAPASPSPMPVGSGPTQQQVHVNRPLGSDKKPKKCGTVSMQKAAQGVKFTIGFPKDGSGSKVQSVMFNSKQWTAEKAAAWLKEHDMKGGDPDVTANFLRYRQEDPEKFARLRVIVPGAKTAKSLTAVRKHLNTEDSWNMIQSLVGNALHDEVGKSDQSMPWIKDFHNDSVIYDTDGGTYRREFSIEEDSAGENVVKFGDPELVNTFYLTDSDESSNENPALNKRLTELQSRAKQALSRIQ